MKGAGPLLIFGASGHGMVVADTARAAGFGVVAFADDDPTKRGATLLACPVVATGLAEAREWLTLHGGRAVVGIGDNLIRARVVRGLIEAEVPLATVIHPHAWISPSATLGPGTVAFAGAIVQAEARIGANTILNTACSIDHECVLGDHVHLSPGVHLGGQVRVGAGTHLGIGASVIQLVRIGAWTTVGAGAAVVRDLPDEVVAYGVPARTRRSK